MTAKKLLQPLPSEELPMTPQLWQPHPYQQQAVKWLIERGGAGLFLEPGLGKTAITLSALKILKARGMMRKALVIAPLRVLQLVWPAEQKKWSNFASLSIQSLHGDSKDLVLASAPSADVYVINPEGLEWLLDWKVVKSAKGRVSIQLDVARFKHLGFDILVVDELSKFKATDTNRFKGLKHVLHTFARRWGLTGSPAPESLMDLFGQCYVLDEGNALGPYITHFRETYFDQNPYSQYEWNLKPGADKLIHKKIKPLALSMATNDYLKLPKMIINDIEVELPEKVMDFYKDLEKDLIGKIEDRTVVAGNAAVASGKLRQVANGGIYVDQEVKTLLKMKKADREWLNLHTEKVDALADLIGELQGDPVLVAYDFEHDMDRIRRKLGKDVPFIGGGTTLKRAKELERLWNAGKLPVLFGHPQSIAHGVNLQERAKHVAWHSLTWSFELYDQFIKRVLRQGNTAARVFVHRFLAKGTIDYEIRDTLSGKDHTQKAVFEALKRLRRRR